MTNTLTSSQTPSPAVIEISNLMKSFNGQEILKNLSLQLFEGENLVVLGQSGSGKSVLIKCIIRLLIPDGGSIKVLGEEIGALDDDKLSVLRKKIGFLFQSGALYDSMTVRKNLEFPLKRMRKDIAPGAMAEKIVEALANVGLSDVLDKMPSELSGGMRKRVSLARTVVVDPTIMLYDEPTTGLDPASSEEISTLINEIKIKYKTSSIIITHDMACARLTADRLIMLKDGAVHKEGNLDLFENSTDSLIQSFFKH